MDTKDERLLREWLAKQLKKGDVPDSLWAHLKEEHYVSEVLDNFTNREDLLAKARQQVQISCGIADEWRGVGSLPGGGYDDASAHVESSSPASETLLTDYEISRSQAFNEYLAKAAEGYRAVQNFRERILGSDELTLEQARDLVMSPSLRFLSPSWFLANGVSILDKGVQITGQERRPRPKFPNFTDLIVHVELPDGRKVSKRIAMMTNQQPDVLVLPRIEGLIGHNLEVWPGSILSILHNLSAGLAQEFTWQEEDAALYLLTGEVPSVSPLRWSEKRYGNYDFEHWVTSMTAAPWVSADTVSRFYRYLQKGRGGRINRPLSDRNVAVFRFVIGRLQPARNNVDATLGMRRVPMGMIVSRSGSSGLIGPSWRNLLDLWNRAHPGEWEYKDVRRFSRDFYRAHGSITGSPYRQQRAKA